jgi:hypothetical protein
MRLAALLIALLLVLWYAGAFRMWRQLEYKQGRGPRSAGEWVAFLLGWFAIIAAILFFLGRAFG